MERPTDGVSLVASINASLTVGATEDIETRMAPLHKHVDQILSDFTFGKEHLKDPVPENHLQFLRLKSR
jgi:hypothetical protein